MAAQPRTGTSVEEYLAFERASDEKHEYRDGEIAAMAGASLHTRLLGKPCRVLPSDLRVFVPASRLFTYPDLAVVCGPPYFSDDRQDTLLNPQIIIEVLSPATQGYDHRGKFRHYRTIESLREYVLIEQDGQRVEHFARQSNDRWLLADTKGPDATLTLPTLDCAIPLPEIYEEFQFVATGDGDV